ncbi:MAG: hypothetical protein KIT81_18095 [Alphaproteobacteria bacterium]|nr:hypothetical protein [Alphaproteobacteria bacterium]
MSDLARKLAGVLALLLALAGCQPVPRPFQTAEPPPETVALLQPRASAGLLIAPMQGLAPGTARRLVELLAEELRKREIPASARAGNSQSHILHGEARIASSGSPVTEIEFAWRLTDPRGLEEGRLRLAERVPGDQLNDGREALLAELAKRVAPRLEALVRGEPDRADEPAARRPIRAVLLPIDPAPGDAATSVARALTAGLFRREIVVLREANEDTYAVAGAIRLRDAGLQEEVSIEWKVLDPSGKVLGTVNQGNFVPKGQLSGLWGDVAAVVGEGGAAGVAEILKAVAGSGARAGGR